MIKREREDVDMLAIYLSLAVTEAQRETVQQVYEQYYGWMLYLAKGYFPQPDDAQDVVHDAIVKIIRHPDCVDTGDAVKTKAFCAAVVRHTALDKLKQKEHAVIYLEDYKTEPFDPTDFAVSRDSYNDLVREIRALDEPLRIVLTLKYVNDLSLKQIAAILDESESAVSMRLTRAKRKLRKALEEEASHA